MDSDPFNLVNLIYFICIIFLVGLSALFSSMETAFSSVATARLKSYEEDGDKRAPTALKILDRYQYALTTILIGNNIVNIGCSSIGTLLCVRIFGNYGAAISTGIITLLVLTFGEVLPKNMAKKNSEGLCLATAGFLNVLMIIFKPFSRFFTFLSSVAQKISGRYKQKPTVTENELKYIIESIEGEGVLEEQESELVQSALDFDDTTVGDILTPRVDVSALDVDAPFEVNKQIIIEDRFSRFPVYKDSIDNIIGILHSRDYLEEIIKGSQPDIQKLVTPACFVYKTKKLSYVLAEFKRNRLHIAIVVDEYGGTLGIVTMEDLLEELVGEIWDEDEIEESKITKLNDSLYRLDGDVYIDEFAELFNLSPKLFEETESNTIGGWVYENIGSIPEKGSTFTFNNIKITVERVQEKRIEYVLAEKLPGEE
ncbi:MAG: hemolysin family protein [Clostridiales bacterium]|nr:hemolysin family protein [Clostridiales bacterium]